MKTKKYLLLLILSFIGVNTFAQSQTAKKTLIVYYSWGGNTRNMAEQIKGYTNADIFEIVPTTAYPKDYTDCTKQAKKEIEANFKPTLKSKPNNLDAYDTIIVGSPNWWGTIAPPVASFLSSYNFKGKTILPFITHEGSRMGRSVESIKQLCPGATILEGLPIRGSSVKSSGSEIQKWLKDNKLAK